MTGRNPPEAVQSFADTLQDALGCITRAPVRVQAGYYPAADPHDLFLTNGEPVPLRGGARVSLSVKMRYRIVRAEGERGPWKVSVAAYQYAFVDEAEREIVAYHWHPDGTSDVTTPHLHLEAGARVGRRDLAAAHIPTGRVSLESIVRLAIGGFFVSPLRREWQSVLDRGDEAFRRSKTW